MATSETCPRVALVTGAAHRIGRAITEALAADGWRVAIHVRRSREAADALARKLEAQGAKACVLVADLANAQETEGLIEQCARALGPPTCLINNASEFAHDTLDSLTLESWSRHLDVNLRAPVILTRDMARYLPEGAEGNVINLIDQRVLRPTPEFFSYGVSKAALAETTRMMAQALAPRIRVNAIAPGPALQSVHQSEADFVAESASTLLQRGTSPDEIARAVRFLLDAPAITGQMITLDGGQHLAFEAASAHTSGLGASGRS